jgi:hypothetical protein
MAKLQVRKHAKPLKAQPGSKIPVKSLRGLDGRKVTVRAIDANSDTFSADFLYVFKQNVRKARKENKDRFGAPDRVGRSS